MKKTLCFSSEDRIAARSPGFSSAGPGVMTSLLLLMAQAHGRAANIGALFTATVCVFLLAWLVLHVGERVMARIGEAGAHIATRVLGVALAALAIQFILNGLTGFYHALVTR